MTAYSRNSAGKQPGPGLDDCQKLWDTLVTEYVTDLGIRIMFQAAKMPAYRACIVVWSPGLDPETGEPRDHIWATTDLPKAYIGLSYVQLYDSLIHAYREIQGFFGGQEDMQLP